MSRLVDAGALLRALGDIEAAVDATHGLTDPAEQQVRDSILTTEVTRIANASAARGTLEVDLVAMTWVASQLIGGLLHATAMASGDDEQGIEERRAIAAEAIFGLFRDNFRGREPS